MRRVLCGVAAGLMMSVFTTNAFAQAEGKSRRDGELYGLLQVGVTTGDASDPSEPKLALGADFGEAINQRVDVYLSGGWQEEVLPGLRDTLHLTSGVKFMLSRGTVRPYLLAGAGVMRFRVTEGAPISDKNKFLGEVGAGLAFPVGTNGYVDVAYRYYKPYNFPDFTPNGVFAGFGFRY